MKRLFVLIFCCLCCIPASQAAPAAITDLAISEAGFRHVTLTWSTPFDAGAGVCASSYEIRLSTTQPIISATDWDNNSASTAFPYRITFSTAGVTAGQRVSRTITGLVNGRACFFAIRSSTDSLNLSAVDSSSPEPFYTPFNTAPDPVSGHNYIWSVIVTTGLPRLVWEEPAAGSDDGLYGDRIVSYTIELAKDISFGTKLSKEGIATTYWMTDALEENSSYFWRARAYDQDGLCSPSYLVQADRCFVVNAVSEPPTVPSLLTPAPDSVETVARPIFLWSAATDPDPADSVAYEISYSTGIDFGVAITTTVTGIAALQYQPADDLIENATYYWKVAARDETGLATVSTTTFAFAVNAYNSPPLAFALCAPADGVLLTTAAPQLSWASTIDPDPVDAFTYSVYYSSQDPVLVSYTTEVAGLATTTYTLPPLQEDATYWWKVKADDGDLNMETAVRSFYINAENAAPSPFDLLASSGMVTTASPLFDWQDTVDPDGGSVQYTIFYSTYQDLSVALSSAGLTASQFIPSPPLQENTTYYWKVEAYDTYGSSTVSNQVWVTIIDAQADPPAPFDLVSPADHATISLLEPLLDWQDTVDPDPDDRIESYELHYSTYADFAFETVVAGLTVSSCAITGGLRNDATYYWKVKAIAAVSGETFSSGTWQFRADNRPPAVFELLSSSGTLPTTIPSFDWQDAADPEGDPVLYTVYYSTYADFSSVVSSAGLSASQYTPAPDNRPFRR